MINRRCDILNLEWASQGRDIDIVEPVLSYLELTHGLTIQRSSIFNAGWKLLKFKPRLLLIADQGGGNLNFQAVRFATRIGVPVVTLRSEGMFPDEPESFKRMFWGWNTDQRFYEVLHLEWSQRTVELTHRYLPQSHDFNIRVSGATGFDRYRLLRMETRAEFLSRRGVGPYNTVVGLAGWAFSHVVGEYYTRHRDAVHVTLGGDAAVSMHRAALPRLRHEYLELVRAHPDTLFVARLHPGEVEEDCSEFTLIQDQPNVIVSRRADDNIADVISASDLWVAYESTTALEAWLLDKPTVLLNPLGGEFKRAEVSAGSPSVRTAAEVTEVLSELRESGSIRSFDELKQVRDSLVDRTIGFSDGRNHQRAADLIMEVFGKVNPPRDIGLDVLRQITAAVKMELLVRSPLAEYSSTVRGTERLRNMFDHEQRIHAARRYRRALEEFHS